VVYGGRSQLTSVPSNVERQRTEVGQPMDGSTPLGVVGAPPLQTPLPGSAQMPAGNPFGGPPPGAMYTPPGGNVAYPTPAAIPGAPPRTSGGGGGRTVLLVVAGLIGVASVVAIVFALRGSGSSGPVKFDTPANPPPTATAATTTPGGHRGPAVERRPHPPGQRATRPAGSPRAAAAPAEVQRPGVRARARVPDAGPPEGSAAVGPGVHRQGRTAVESRLELLEARARSR
jgi:hypothetical protein